MEEQKLISLDFSILSEEVIEVLLLDSTAEPSLYEEIARKNTHRPEVLRHILNHTDTPEATRQFVAQTLHVPVPKEVMQEEAAETFVEEPIKKARTESLLQRIQKMKVGEKIQLALRGNRDIRTILIRDPNKEVMLTVLENHKITSSEIEIIAKQKTTHDEVLRTIAKKREWLKNYAIVHSLVTNPKTPKSIAVKHVTTIRLKDLELIQRNRNIAEAVRAVAKKLIVARRLS